MMVSNLYKIELPADADKHSKAVFNTLTNHLQETKGIVVHSSTKNQVEFFSTGELQLKFQKMNFANEKWEAA